MIKKTVATKREEPAACVTCGHRTCPSWCGRSGPGAWLALAVCGTIDPETFFPDGKSGRFRISNTADAKRICNSCPVRTECLEYAIAEDLDHGIWGGTTPQDRRYRRGELVEALRKRRANERRLAEAL